MILTSVHTTRPQGTEQRLRISEQRIEHHALAFCTMGDAFQQQRRISRAQRRRFTARCGDTHAFGGQFVINAVRQHRGATVLHHTQCITVTQAQLVGKRAVHRRDRRQRITRLLQARRTACQRISGMDRRFSDPREAGNRIRQCTDSNAQVIVFIKYF